MTLHILIVGVVVIVLTLVVGSLGWALLQGHEPATWLVVTASSALVVCIVVVVGIPERWQDMRLVLSPPPLPAHSRPHARPTPTPTPFVPQVPNDRHRHD